MLIPTLLLLLLLLFVVGGGLYKLKRRYLDHDEPPPDIRPSDHLPTSHPDLTNPTVSAPYDPWSKDRPWMWRA